MNHWTIAELRAIYALWPSDYGVLEYILLMYHNNCMFKRMMWMIATGRIQVIQVNIEPPNFRGMWN